MWGFLLSAEYCRPGEVLEDKTLPINEFNLSSQTVGIAMFPGWE